MSEQLTIEERRSVIANWFAEQDADGWLTTRTSDSKAFAELAYQLGVSKTTFREDLYRLSENHVLRLRTVWRGTAYHSVFQLRYAPQTEVVSS